MKLYQNYFYLRDLPLITVREHSYFYGKNKNALLKILPLDWTFKLVQLRRIKWIYNTYLFFRFEKSWSCGQNSFRYSVPINRSYTVEYKGGDWLALEGRGGRGGKEWTIKTTFDTFFRSDINNINSSPRVISPPIIKGENFTLFTTENNN